MNTSLAKIKGFYTHVIISCAEKWLQESFPYSHFFINYMILYIEHFCCHIPWFLNNRCVEVIIDTSCTRIDRGSENRQNFLIMRSVIQVLADSKNKKLDFI